MTVAPKRSEVVVFDSAKECDAAKGVYHSSKLKRDTKLRVAMTMSDSDSNKNEMERAKTELSRSRYRVFEFKGGHVWAPPEVFAEAMAWILEGKNGKSSTLKR